MPRKPNPRWDDPEQSKRFIEAAKRAEASDDPNDFAKALKVVATQKPKPKPSR